MKNVTFRDTFRNIMKNPIIQIRRFFTGGANSRVGHGQAWTGPARGIFESRAET